VIFSSKGQLNQSQNTLCTMLTANAARSKLESCSLVVTDLSVWSRYENPVSHGISNACFHPLKITKQ